jgi:hypothetical protein
MENKPPTTLDRIDKAITVTTREVPSRQVEVRAEARFTEVSLASEDAIRSARGDILHDLVDLQKLKIRESILGPAREAFRALEHTLKMNLSTSAYYSPQIRRHLEDFKKQLWEPLDVWQKVPETADPFGKKIHKAPAYVQSPPKPMVTEDNARGVEENPAPHRTCVNCQHKTGPVLPGCHCALYTHPQDAKTCPHYLSLP